MAWDAPLLSRPSVPGMLPPGSEDRIGIAAVSISDALDYLATENAEARAALQEGCIGSIMHVIHQASVGALVPGVTEPQFFDEFHFYVTVGDEVKRWFVDHNTNPPLLEDHWRWGYAKDHGFGSGCYDGFERGVRDSSWHDAVRFQRQVAPLSNITAVFIPPPAKSLPEGFPLPHWPSRLDALIEYPPEDDSRFLWPPQVAIVRETGWLGFAIISRGDYERL